MDGGRSEETAESLGYLPRRDELAARVVIHPSAEEVATPRTEAEEEKKKGKKEEVAALQARSPGPETERAAPETALVAPETVVVGLVEWSLEAADV